jgi:hypothetical protein
LIAGWVISEVSIDLYGNKNFKTTFVQDGKIRYESELSVAIIDIKSAEITMIYPAEKVYWTGTAKEYNKQTKKALIRQIEEFFDEIETEDKDLFKNYIDSLKIELASFDSTYKTANITIKKLPDKKTVKNYLCTGYKIFLDTIYVENIWVTDSLNPYKDIDVKKLMEITAQMNPLNKEISITNSKKYISILKNGLIIKTEKIVNNNTYYTTTLTNINSGNIPETFFTPPQFYRKASITEIVDLSSTKAMPILPSTDDNGLPDPFKSNGFK